MNPVTDILDPSQIHIEMLEKSEERGKCASSTPATEARTQAVQQKTLRELVSPTEGTQGILALPFEATVYAKTEEDPAG